MSKFSTLFPILLLVFLIGPTPNISAQCTETEVTVISTTGNYAEEMYWEIHDANGNVVVNWQGQQNFSADTFLLCVADGCYTFTAMDSFGDGWNGGMVNLSWASASIDFELPGGSADLFYFGINETDCIPQIPGCIDPSAYNYDTEATVDDGSCLLLADVIATQVIDTLCYGGPKDNRINFVIQNRGVQNTNNDFTSSEEFSESLGVNFVPAFDYNHPGAKQPYAQYKNFFNLFAAYWPNAPGDHNWWGFDVIHDMRDSIFLPWSDDERGWVTWFSTTRNGGGGGAGRDLERRVGSGKMFGTDYETLLHEFAHTMPSLPDEYTSSGVWSNNQCWESGNTTGHTVKDSIPWRLWIEDDTPLPTPYDGSYENKIGAFEGALTNYFGCHRPTAKGCYMGAGGFGEGYGDDLCAPCIQRVICRLYQFVNVIEDPFPANTDLSVSGSETISFSTNVVAPEPNTQQYQWLLNGKVIAENTTSVDVTFGFCDTYELKFTVLDTTPLVRYDEKFEHIYPRPYQERIWTINQEDVSSYDLSTSITSSNADCTGMDNGMVTLLPSGGLAPYEYWLEGNPIPNPTTGLAAEDYQFTVVDANGCAVTTTTTIEQDNLLDLEICSTNENGWEVTVNSENYDVDALDLNWSTGDIGPVLTNVTDGNYSVTATINGCSIVTDFNLSTSPAALNSSHQFFPSELGAATGVIYVAVDGGVPDYQIEWYDRLIQDQTDDNVNNISTSGTTWGHLPEMAFDDDLNTKWLHAVNSDAWISYSFPSPTTIAYYTITSGNDVEERDPQDWRLEGSNDGVNWTNLDERQDQDFPSRLMDRSFSINNPAPYSHYRFYVLSSAGNNQIQIQELAFIGADPAAPFLYNAEFDGAFTRTELAPGEYRYEISDASSACSDAEIGLPVYEGFSASGLTVIKESDCAVRIESPDPAYDYFWLSDVAGTVLLGTGISFEPPFSGNYYVAAATAGSNQWSSNRKGFAVTLPTAPEIMDAGNGTLTIIDPDPSLEYRWYDVDDCSTPINIGTDYVPGNAPATFYIAAIGTQAYPDPIDPTNIDGLMLRMDAADLDGDGFVDDPAPSTSSMLDWTFPTGNQWHAGSYFSYRSNYQNGLGIADWATLWLQRIEFTQNEYQTVLLAYQENALSWENTAPWEGLSTTMPRHSDASQLFSDDAPASTLNGNTYLNGTIVDPLNTANPMEFCVLGSVFTEPANASIFYTDVHWEGKVGEILFYDKPLSETEMKGVSEYLRQKWVSTADLESPRTPFEWMGLVNTAETFPFDINIYPNPNNGVFNVQTKEWSEANCQVFNSLGQIVFDAPLQSEQQSFNLSRLTAGIYLVKVSKKNGGDAVGRIVIK